MKKALITKIIVLSLAAIFLIGALIYGMSNSFGFDVLKKDVIELANSDFKYNYEYTQEVDKLDSFDIDWSSGGVELKYYDGKSIKITEYSTLELDEDQKLTLEEDGTTLKINWDSSPSIFNFLPSLKYKKLVVEIPTDMTLDTVAVKTASGAVSARELTATSINLSSTSGKVSSDGCKANKMALGSTSGSLCANGAKANILNANTTSGAVAFENSIGYTAKLSSVSGAISFSGGFTSISAQSTSGSVKLQTNLLIEKADLSSVSGSIQLIAPEDTSAKVTASSVSGSFSSSFASALSSGKNASFTLGDGSGEINLSTTSGSIKLNEGGASEKPTELFPKEESSQN